MSCEDTDACHASWSLWWHRMACRCHCRNGASPRAAGQQGAATCRAGSRRMVVFLKPTRGPSSGLLPGAHSAGAYHRQWTGHGGLEWRHTGASGHKVHREACSCKGHNRASELTTCTAGPACGRTPSLVTGHKVHGGACREGTTALGTERRLCAGACRGRKQACPPANAPRPPRCTSQHPGTCRRAVPVLWASNHSWKVTRNREGHTQQGSVIAGEGGWAATLTTRRTAARHATPSRARRATPSHAMRATPSRARHATPSRARRATPSRAMRVTVLHAHAACEDAGSSPCCCEHAQQRVRRTTAPHRPPSKRWPHCDLCREAFAAVTRCCCNTLAMFVVEASACARAWSQAELRAHVFLAIEEEERRSGGEGEGNRSCKCRAFVAALLWIRGTSGAHASHAAMEPVSCMCDSNGVHALQ
eukprot:365072-Chlamydomonas_euryale.AAC.5